MTLNEIFDKIIDATDRRAYFHGGYAYPFVGIKMEMDQITDLIKEKKASTRSVLGAILDQKKWQTTKFDEKATDYMDAAFRWPAVECGYQLIGLEYPNESENMQDYLTNLVLLVGDGKNFVGVRTQVYYRS